MPDEKVAFDVFLSHNGKDKPAVRRIQEALEARGLNVWLDETELIPGRRWIDALQQALEQTATVAVCIGENGVGPWERSEIEGALIQSVDRGLPVIPVLLPNAPADVEVPLFLRAFTRVDLRAGMTDSGLGRLEWGIRGKKTSGASGASRPLPPRLHNLPFSSLGDLLKGRDEELRKLQDGAATAITQAETIYGLGGIGKTRLAVEHAWRSGNLYDSAFFVVAESPEALHSNLANLARPDLLNLPEYKGAAQEESIAADLRWREPEALRANLANPARPDLLNLPEHKAAAKEESVAAVLRWLREHDRWLLILDNVDTKEAEQAVLKIVPSLSAGRVLITSRIQDWPAGIQTKQIGILKKNEAQRFILKRTADRRNKLKNDRGQALRLAEELGGLPLALEQAAAYIAQRQMSLSKYLEEWEKEREKVLNWYDGSVMQYPTPVATTWQKTFQELRPTAAAILRLTAYLAPDPIPPKMFENRTEIIGEAVGMLCEEMGAQVENGSVGEAIIELASYSMMTRKAESITVHRMVQDALRSRIPEKRRRDWIERSLRLVDDFSPATPSDARTWPIWDSLRPHAARIIQIAYENGIAHPTAQLMNQLALLLLSKSLYHEAEPLMRRALRIDEDSLGPQHPDVARDLNNLAQLLQDTNRLSEAEPLMRRALRIDEDFFGAQHPNVAIRLNNLASLLQATNRLSEAEPLMRSALRIDEDFFGAQHPNVAIRLNNLASLLQATNRLSEAEPLKRRALQINEASFGPQHPNVATDLNNLAQLLQATNRLPEAEPLMRRALQIDEDSFGPQHPKIALRLNNLASLLQATNRLSEAEPLMRRALQIDEDSFGPQHPNVAIDLNNLASLLKATNRLSEAEPLMRRAVEIFETSLGTEHPNTQIVRRNLDLLLRKIAAQSEPPSPPRMGGE